MVLNIVKYMVKYIVRTCSKHRQGLGQRHSQGPYQSKVQQHCQRHGQGDGHVNFQGQGQSQGNIVTIFSATAYLYQNVN